MAKTENGHPYTSSEERSTHELCGAKKKNGEICRAYAGQSTTHPGIGRCKFHGGSTPNHNKSATLTEAKRHMVTLGGPLDVTADQALRGVLRATAGHVAWLAAEVAQLGDVRAPEARTLVDLYSDERDRLTRVARACIDFGIPEEEVKMQRRQAEAISEVVNRALDAVGGLSDEQRRQFGTALREGLASLAGSGVAAAEDGGSGV